VHSSGKTAMTRALIPNSTQIPDIILDHWMAELSGAEMKVLLYIARRTYGFGKESDNISLNQMAGGIKRRDGTCLDHGTGLSRSGVKAACNALIERGLLVRVNNRSEENRECEESTYRLNLYAPPARVGQKKAHVGQNEAQVGQKGAGGRAETDRGAGQKLAPQETDLQETDQETAAGEGSGEAEGAAAEALVDELVSHGVGRTAAARFAREKPETCLRQLEYLPHASFRTTKGAWLANAIQGEFGPPSGYEAEKARKARERDATARVRREMANQKRGAAIREASAARLSIAYQKLHASGSEALLAFNEFVGKERAKTARIAIYLSPERRDELLASFDSPGRRLELFDAWMKSAPGFSLQGPGSSAADFRPSPCKLQP
jgi:hypothetical protein